MLIALPLRSTRPVRTALRRTALAVLLSACAFSATPSWAQNAPDTAEVQRLLRAGQLDQALQRADAFLASRPRDAQMRFLKGLIFTEQKKTQDAINIFQKLTEDFPELPEPYNNLAVLYAGQGQYDKARGALELAIRTDPRYATAYENLGDVYAKLASQAYDRALQLDGSNNIASTKLSLIRDMIGGLPAQPPRAAARPTPAAPSPAVTPAPAPVTAASPAPAATPTPAAPAGKAPEKAPEPVRAAPSDSEEVLKAVRAWAAAWSKQDVNTYLSSYGKEFKPPKGLTRTQWEAERRARINGKGEIRVEVLQPSVTIKGDSAKVSFRQNYRSDRLDTSTRKTLTLNRQGARWVIVSEVAGG